MRKSGGGGGVCLVPCVACACGATMPGVACYRMAAGGVLGGDASGAPHVSLMMVPAAPRRIDARVAIDCDAVGGLDAHPC